MPGEKQQARVTNVLQQLGIEHLAERGYAELSGGERQMVLIARALVQDADILIMDEPTANLDYGNQFHILNRFAHSARPATSFSCQRTIRSMPSMFLIRCLYYKTVKSRTMDRREKF